MNSCNKHKVIIWILAGCLIITLSILGSFIYHSRPEPREFIAQASCSSSCMMLFHELDMDEDQQDELENILDHFRDSSAILLSSLRQRRLALMEELQKDHPDSLRISSLSEELGTFQIRMTRHAVAQYLQIRTICKPGQQQLLSNVYCDIFGCSHVKMGQGHGHNGHSNGRK